MPWIVAGLGVVVLAVLAYVGVVTGAVPIDIGVGRRTRPLGPQTVEIEAPRELVFDIIATPYLGRPPRAVANKIQILERGDDLVLAAHKTPLHGGRLVATTVETVRFERPYRVHFRLVRGPVPYVVEQFVLEDDGGATRLEYRGELGTDLWFLGSWWGRIVARTWERTVVRSLEAVTAEAERRDSTSRE